VSDRQVQRDDRLPEPRPQLPDHDPEVGALTVEVVDDDEVRDALPLSSAPHTLGHDLDGVLGMNHQDRAVGHPLGDESVPDKAPVPGGVEHIDLAPLPLEVGDAHAEGHAALGLLVGVVQNATRRAAPPGSQPDHALGYRGLAATPVPDQAHVPNRLRLYRHGFSFPEPKIPFRPLPRAGTRSLTQDKPSRRIRPRRSSGIGIQSPHPGFLPAPWSPGAS
jgi:hypothetical protein